MCFWSWCFSIYMRTKIVYVLVSQNTDYYYEMLLLSLYSLRLHHPKGDAVVEVVMDEDTHQRLVDKKSEMLNDVSSIVVSIPSEYTVMQRSRYLKTQLRQLVKGDFLFLDTDTVVCSNLNEVDSFPDEICAVLDNHFGEIIEDQVNMTPESLGWKWLKGTKHYNSGVLFVKETKNAYSFFIEWHSNWKHGASYGVYYDQLSLRKTIAEDGTSIGELNGIWNCQVFRTSSSPYLKNAKIVHYYSHTISRQAYDICSDTTLLIIRITGKVSEGIAEMVRQSQGAFYKRRVYVTTEESILIKDMLAARIDFPNVFQFIVKASSCYRYLITKLWRIKMAICNRFKLLP